MGHRETTADLISAVGLGVEEHRVETGDGFILVLHRIVGQDCQNRHVKQDMQDKQDKQDSDVPVVPRPVTFLQHGLVGSSADWCIGARNKALGFLLWDSGYDVWLGNFRGNTYSRQHREMRNDQQEFWEWSFDEMGQQDLPAMLSHVLTVTGQQQLTYIGHSMGTMAFWVMMNARPWMNATVNLMVGLAPIAAVHLHPANLLNMFVPVAEQVVSLLKLTGQYEFASRDSFTTELQEMSFNKVYGLLTSRPLRDIYLSIAPQADLQLLPTVMRHFPAGTSARNMLHFAQGVREGGGQGRGRFLPYSFPTEQENFEMYGAEEPREYSLRKVTCPVLLYWGEGDWMSQPRGVEGLAKELPNLVDSVRVQHETWNHFDFLCGRNADTLLYGSVLKAISTFSGVASTCHEEEGRARNLA